MASTSSSPSVYHEDVVFLSSQPSNHSDPIEFGLVCRTYHEENEDEEVDESFFKYFNSDPDSIERPLREGEIGISMHPSGRRLIISESQVQVVDR